MVLLFKERPLVSVPHFELDDHCETVQGEAQSVKKLFQDYVLGRLDPSQISYSPVYDNESSEEVDPFNNFGITLEDVTRIGDEGRAAKNEARCRMVTDHPIENSKQPGKEQPPAEPKSDS